MEFSPTSAVPGEEVTLKLKALPHSLCGLSAVDQSVLVKEPGETLTADMVNASTTFHQDIFVEVSENPGPSTKDVVLGRAIFGEIFVLMRGDASARVHLQL